VEIILISAVAGSPSPNRHTLRKTGNLGGKWKYFAISCGNNLLAAAISIIFSQGKTAF